MVEVREVKRKANVGEYIKIVDESWTNGKYKNGDVLEVERSTRRNDGYIKTYCKGISIHINQREYVVLEGYKPPTPSHPSFLLKYYIAKLSDGNIESFDCKCKDVEIRGGDFAYFYDVQGEVLAIIPTREIRGIYRVERGEE